MSGGGSEEAASSVVLLEKETRRITEKELPESPEQRGQLSTVLL